MIDNNSQVQKKIRIFQGDDYIDRAAPNSNMSRPLIYHEGYLYITGLALGVEPIPDYTQHMNAYHVNLENGEVRTFLPRPPDYNQAQYGLFPLYQIFCTENLDKSGIIYGFGLTPDIYEVKYEEIEHLEAHCLKSKEKWWE